MNGILIIDKPNGVTSRDVVNDIVKKFNTKKVGHTGTLDPIATGVLVICIGSATKLVDEITATDKEYLVSATLGTLTDTLDSEGKVLKEEKCIRTKDEILAVLESFKGSYIQEVPIYSAVKVNGKKLYEYARTNKEVNLPKREVNISNIELIDDIKYNNDKTIINFKCTVSKGTYIRSLVRDISTKLNTVGTMTSLIRTRQGKFKIEDSIPLDQIKLNNLISIKDVLDVKKVELTNSIEKKVLNGALIDNIYDSDKVLFLKNNEAVALYKSIGNKLKIDKMFIGGIK